MAIDAVTIISGSLAERPDATSVSVDTKFIDEATGDEYFCSKGATSWTASPSSGGPSTASELTNVPAGNIVATDVQAAINELDSDKQAAAERGSPDGYASLNGDGVVPATELGSGTADATTFLRGDRTWQTIAGGGTDDQIASEVAFTPAGNIAATDVQAALVELDTEKSGTGHAHSSPPASGVAYTPAGNVAATDVQAAITELDTEKSPTTHNHDGTYSAAAHNHDVDYEAAGAVNSHNAQTTSVHGITDTAALVTTDNTGLISPVVNYGTDNTTARPNRAAVIWIGTDRTIDPDNIDAADALIQPGLYSNTIVKPSDTARASTTTIAADPHLTDSVAANSVYEIVVYAIANGNGSGGAGTDFKAGWTYPAGATMTWFPSAFTLSASGGSASVNLQAKAINETQGYGLVNTSTNIGMTFRGILTTSGTAGSIAFAWAQEASDAVATTVITGSYMKIAQIS